MSWSREGEGIYVRDGHRVHAVVVQTGELWQGSVYIDGGMVSKGEWSSREDALRNANGAISRACHLRRFDKAPPVCSDPEEDEDDDDEDDDE